MTQLQARSLSEEDKDRHEKIMLSANPILKKRHKQVKKALGTGYLKLSRADFRCQIFELMGKTIKDVTIAGVTIPAKEMALFKSVEALQEEILQGYVKFIRRYITKWKAICHDQAYDINDFYNEAIQAAIQATFCYTKPAKGGKVRFITYLGWCIDRRLKLISNRFRSNGTWTNHEIALWWAYEKARVEFNAHMTFDEICLKMKLKEKDIRILSNLMTSVISETAIVADESAFLASNDFTARAAIHQGLNGDTYTILGNTPQGGILQKAKDIPFDIMGILKQISLTEWETIVLKACMDGTTGWQTRVAAENINPTTGKPYSRMAPGLALARIREKIDLKLKEAA